VIACLDAETEAAKGRANPEVAGESAIPGHAGPAGPGEGRVAAREVVVAAGRERPTSDRTGGNPWRS